ncbi:MAG: sigma-70 family RNA polymerase sigma factor [Candidatus Aminicenantes bacterium]|nr:sigma-70 family RNA polymerase sigma factor [Candidatus Aminicenantes bacterium]
MQEETVLQRETVFMTTKDRMNHQAALSESEILTLVQKGDREAYQKIVVRHMRSAYYVALAFVHNHQDALDLSPEAFIKAFRKIKKFDTERPFFPWFYRILKNLCIDHYKHRRRLNEVPLENVRVLEVEHEDREMKKALWKGIDELPDEQKEIIVLRYFQQLSYQEIAEILDKPIGTVMSSLYYAKKRLKGIVGKYLGFE